MMAMPSRARVVSFRPEAFSSSLSARLDRPMSQRPSETAWMPEPEPVGRVSGYGESNIEYTVRVWCKTADYWTVYYDLMEAVGAAFDAHGVSMSYPQMNVHVLDTPESAKKD